VKFFFVFFGSGLGCYGSLFLSRFFNTCEEWSPAHWNKMLYSYWYFLWVSDGVPHSTATSTQSLFVWTFCELQLLQLLSTASNHYMLNAIAFNCSQVLITTHNRFLPLLIVFKLPPNCSQPLPTAYNCSQLLGGCNYQLAIASSIGWLRVTVCSWE